MAFVIDTFPTNGATPGANWTTQVVSRMDVASSQLGAPADTNIGSERYSGQSFGTDQYAKVVTAVMETDSANQNFGIGPAVRMSSVNQSKYIAVTQASRIFLVKCDTAGTTTLLQTYTGSVAVGNDVTLEASGTTTTALVVKLNGTQVLSHSDSTSALTTGGVGAYGNVGNVFSRIDTWEGGDLGAIEFEQEGFRWRNDDGPEASATWAAAQDTNISGSLNTRYRLRALTNVVGDAGATAFRWEYKKSTDGGWKRLQTLNQFPTLTFGTASATTFTAASAASISASYPTAITTQSALVYVVGMKPTVTTGGTASTPSGWTLVTSSIGGGGYGVAPGVDTGNTNVFVYSKDTVTGTESGTVGIALGSNNVAWGTIVRVDSDISCSWAYAGTTGQDATGDAAVSISFATNPGVQGNDFVLVGMVTPTDVNPNAKFSAEVLTQTGVTYSTVTELNEPNSANGNDIGGLIAYATVTSGTASAAPLLSASAASTVTNIRGPGFFVRLRAQKVVMEPVVIYPSAFVSSSATMPTTTQLAAPTGKTSAVYTAGWLSDDTNPLPTIDIQANGYSESEVTVVATSSLAQAGDIFQFRLTDNGTAFATSSVSPQFNVASAGTATVTASGVAGTSAVGTVTVTAAANISTTGVTATGQTGTASVAAAASVNASGVSATRAVGTVAVTGAAVVALSGVSATSAIGTPTVTAAGPAVVALSGVSVTSAVGTVTVTGAAVVALSGVAATSATGTVVVSGRAVVALSGVAATSAVGTLTVSAAASPVVSGVSSTSAIGTGTESGTATVTASGVTATASVGTLGVSTGNNTSIAATGIGAATAVGTVAVTGNSAVTATGVTATSQTSAPTVHATGAVTVSGVSAASATGTVTAVMLTAVTVFGVAGTAQTGFVIVSATVVVTPVTFVVPLHSKPDGHPGSLDVTTVDGVARKIQPVSTTGVDLPISTAATPRKVSGQRLNKPRR